MLVIYQCTKKGFARASTYSFVIGSSNAPTQALSSRTCLTSAACLGERQWHEDWVYDGQRKITSRHGVDSRPLWEWQKDAWHAAVGVRGFPLRGLARAELLATAKGHVPTAIITVGYRLHGVTSFPIRRAESHALTVAWSFGVWHRFLP